ncbi:MAG TPA: lipid-A-disaccharide synthase [Terriglobales bacterium]|nr:lipid-A-disaccharide synthase [Terriglobales bacterium]
MKLEIRNSKPSFLISAGEASGEAYGAQLLAAIRRTLPKAEFFGLGGQRMRNAGCHTIVDTRNVAVVGLAEVVSHLPKIYANFRRLLRAADEKRPTAAILIDFPDFNFRLARQLHRRGIPVFYFVSPQIWAWRQGRIKLVQKYVQKMLVIFPFEEQFYRERGVEVDYVGHPLADVPQPAISRDNFALDNGLNPKNQWIALMPGSRRKEVVMNLPEMLTSAKLLMNDSAMHLEDGYQFMIPVAPTLDEAWLRSLHQKSRDADVPVVFTHDARATLAHARAAIVASGTATVEAALIGTPFVMVYRVSDLTWKLGRRLVKVPHFGMVNLIAGREVIPEVVQTDFTADTVVRQLRKILPDGPDRTSMLNALTEVRNKLHPFGGAEETAADRAAQSIVGGLA